MARGKFVDAQKRAIRTRPLRVTTEAGDNRIRLISKRNMRLTAPKVTAELNKTRSEKVSGSTVKRRLQEALYSGVEINKKDLSGQEHIRIGRKKTEEMLCRRMNEIRGTYSVNGIGYSCGDLRKKKCFRSA
ncbi:hypothetical protein ILUMI_21433 [Ignelater luminosus]|uniref:Transposase Tc1-like domain-containing protein n=1 Tax=Ignelater luminosus TaxID=2038154 RepID=A0A8K0CIQ6_IGNLU|nr:hypothetical protein ILUMI_21433 [Ignelater luminosus]